MLQEHCKLGSFLTNSFMVISFQFILCSEMMLFELICVANNSVKDLEIAIFPAF